MKLYHPIKLEHYDNDKILNHPDVQAMQLGREWPYNWNLQLFDLKSVLPDFYSWCEEKFKANITVTRFFVTLPNSNTTVHEDYGYTISLNIPVINCANNFNMWYIMKEGSKTKEPNLKRDADGVNYAANDGGAYMFPANSVQSIKGGIKLTEPMLFCTDVPHNTITKETDHNLPRIVLSVRTRNMRRSELSKGWSIDEFVDIVLGE